MFGLCEAMRWNHLPVSGGLYDQDPALLDAFRYIFGEKSAHEAREAKKKNREAENARNNSSLRRSASRGM